MYTIFGGNGFIGTFIKRKLIQDGQKVFVPKKNDNNIFLKDLGNVVYAAGITSDFRSRPYDTVNAHVSYLFEVLKKTTFKNFIYLSSTRIYRNSKQTKENGQIILNSINLDSLYDLSKLTGEAICNSFNSNKIKVVRISNVIGNSNISNNFFDNLLNQARKKKNIILNDHINSEKDYIIIDDVVSLVLKILLHGKYRCYNVASGCNISNKKILELIKLNFNINYKFNHNAKIIKNKIINIDLIKNEFNFVPTSPLSKIKLILK